MVLEPNFCPHKVRQNNILNNKDFLLKFVLTAYDYLQQYYTSYIKFVPFVKS